MSFTQWWLNKVDRIFNNQNVVFGFKLLHEEITMKRQLNFTYPMITTYTTHAHVLGILGTDTKTLQWIFSNYIQVYINEELDKNRWGDFYFPMPYETRPSQLCKWLVTQVLSDEFVELINGGIINFILGSIDKNTYVNLMVNYKYISGSYANKQKIDMVHDLLIYGYDDSKNVFYCADFVYEKNDRYLMFECSFEDLNIAYNDYREKKRNSYFGKNVIYTYTLEEKIDYEYSPINIYNSIKVYLKSSVPEYWRMYNSCDEKRIVFGLNYYDALIKHLNGGNYKFISIRLLYLMFDHKNLMIKRLEYMDEGSGKFNEYISEYEWLKSEMSKVVNLALKFNVTHVEKYIKSIVEKLDNIKEREERVLTKFLELVEHDENK